MEPDQTYKLLHSKENHKQNGKTTYRMGENMCKRCNQQELNILNIQTVHTAQYKKKKPNQKMDRRPPKKTYRWPTGI